MLLLNKLLYLQIHLLLFILIEVDAVQSVLDNKLVPVVIFDDFDDLLLLVGSNYGEDLTDDHFDEGGVVLYELILELVFVEVCSGSVIEGVL